MIEKTKKRFKRICKACGKLFIPEGKYAYHCNICKKESKKRQTLKNQKTWEMKRKLRKLKTLHSFRL